MNYQKNNLILFDIFFFFLGKERILEFKKKYPSIRHDWQKIRNKVMNTIYKEKKNLELLDDMTE